MSGRSQAKSSYDEGREDQYRAMLERLGELEARYKGVRGELLARVRAALSATKPTATGLRVVSAPAEASRTAELPSCRACGRAMRLNGTDGSLVCQNGHTRLL